MAMSNIQRRRSPGGREMNLQIQFRISLCTSRDSLMLRQQRTFFSREKNNRHCGRHENASLTPSRKHLLFNYGRMRSADKTASRFQLFQYCPHLQRCSLPELVPFLGKTTSHDSTRWWYKSPVLLVMQDTPIDSLLQKFPVELTKAS